MKRKLVFALGILLFFGFVSVNCNAQSSNNEQRIVGTWVNESEGSTMTFNANGTGSSSDGSTFKYGVAGDKLAMVIQEFTIVFDFSISSDGKILIIRTPSTFSGMSGNGNGSLLRKRS